MANDNDIFSQLGDNKTVVQPTNGADQTILKPTPGGRRPQSQAAGASQGFDNTARPQSVKSLHNVLDKIDVNPISTVARPLLSLLNRLSQTNQHNDVAGLHNRAVQAVREFEQNAQKKGIDNQQILIARYILCAAIDEIVMNTPWGSNSSWPTKSLLSTFHRENTGGQKLFQIMERMQQNPGVNINLLELIAICLSLGFQGKYRTVQGGANYIETIRTQLHQQIAMVRQEYSHELSPHVDGVHLNRSIDRNIPLWVIAAITGAIIISAYIGFSVSLTNEAEPVLEQLNAINPHVDESISIK